MLGRKSDIKSSFYPHPIRTQMFLNMTINDVPTNQQLFQHVKLNWFKHGDLTSD